MLRQYFLQHLKVERRVSDNTIASYAATFGLLIAFCLGRRKRRASSLEISDLDVDTILAFLRLETERGSGPLTRNARLAALKSFFRYVVVHDVQSLPIAQRVLAIPTKRFDMPKLGMVKIHGKGRKERVVVLSPQRPPSCDAGIATSATAPRCCSRIARAAR